MQTSLTTSELVQLIDKAKELVTYYHYSSCLALDGAVEQYCVKFPDLKANMSGIVRKVQECYRSTSQAKSRCTGFLDILDSDWSSYPASLRIAIRLEKLEKFKRFIISNRMTIASII